MPRDYFNQAEIETVIKEIGEQVAARLRHHHKLAGCLSLSIGFSYVAAEADDEPIRQKSLNAMLKVICKRLDIQSGDKQLSMYSFRHTICTNLANTPGMSYPWAAEKMGHSLQMFMNTYVGVDPDMNKQMNKLWVS